MNCEELEPWISAYEDGELDPRRRRVVEAHVASCPDCRALSQGWAKLARDLRVSLARQEAPESLHGRVMRQIPEPAAGLRARPGSGGQRRWLAVALAPAVAATVGLLWGPRPVSRTPPPANQPISAVPAVEATNPSPTIDGAIQLALPGQPSVLHLVKTRRTTAGPRERAKKTRTQPGLAPANGAASAGRVQGRRPLEDDAGRRPRRLRSARVRYRLAEYRPWDRRRPRRPHSYRALARRPSPLPGPAAIAADGMPRIDVVEYVLPTLQPAQPAPVLEAGLNL